jgi:hypothetical protein
MPKRQSPEEPSTRRLAKSWKPSSGKLKAEPQGSRNRLICGIWENWLTERRREIDRRYDYQYSALPLVFAHLLRDGRLTEDDLNGLEQEKLDLIRRASAL